MSTTSLIVEVLVIGVLSLIGVFVCLIGFDQLSVGEIQSMARKWKDYWSVIAISGLAISYQLGWMVNTLTYFMAQGIFMREIRKSVLSEDANRYDQIRDAIFQHGSSEILRKLDELLSVFRLARATTLVSVVTAVGLFRMNEAGFGVACLAFAAGSGLQARAMYRFYLERVRTAFEAIEKAT